MNKIPKVSYQAIEEAFKSVASLDLNTMEEEEVKNHLKQYSQEFSKRQPELFKFTQQMMENHDRITDGKLVSAQFAIYMTIVVKSLYIQKEIDEVTNLFDFDREDD